MRMLGDDTSPPESEACASVTPRHHLCIHTISIIDPCRRNADIDNTGMFISVCIGPRFALTSLLWLALTWPLVACMSAPRAQVPHDFASDQAMNAQEAQAQALPEDDLAWWQVFQDTTLQTLVQQTLRDNLDLQAERQRLQAERSLAAQDDKEFLPQAAWLSQSVTSASGIDTFYQYGFDASWEMGWFGRKDSQHLRSQGEVLDEAARVRALKVSLVGDLVRAYLQLRQAQQELLLQQQSTRWLQRQAALHEQGVALGLLAANGAQTIERQTLQSRQTMEHWQAQQQRAALRLALLCGRTSPDRRWQQNQPTMTSLPQHYQLDRLPVRLLNGQPDVQRARARLLRAEAAAGLAHADRYPSVNIGAGYFFASNITQNIVFDGDTNATPSLGPVINIPLFDWGRRRRIDAIRRQQMNAAAQDYRAQVRHAYTEVEEDLSALQEQEQNILQHKAILQLDQQNLQSGSARQRLGLAGQGPLIAIHLQAIADQTRLDSAEFNAAIAYIRLYKALGGPTLTRRDTLW